MQIGQRLGAYDVIAKLGEGGMGEVYRARDTRLQRDVAIKILPATFASDADRLMRFEREARTLASLNHPHIAQIYGFEQADAGSALVMELVDGEDLSARMARGPVALDETLAIVRQVADALAAAHDQGIVHRDLKPANIKLRPDGTVKVLDFGLAKAIEGTAPPGSGEAAGLLNSPTITSPAVTAAGIILGTAAYMSPEQARGRPVDKRTDLWALGCLIFEMLTGRQAFGGATVSDVIAGVLRAAPELGHLPAGTPPALRRLLERTLQKDPGQRLRDAADARLEIELAGRELAAPVVAPERPRQSRAPLTWLTASAVALVIGLAAGAWWQASRTRPDSWIATEVGGPRRALLPRIAPDGRLLAFLAVVDGQSQVAVMDASSGDWSLVTTQPGIGAVISVAWSRDGSRIYFDRSQSGGRTIYSVSPLGGESRLVLDNAGSPEPLQDGSVLFTRSTAAGPNQLHRFRPDTGEVRAYPVSVHASFVPALRAFRDGREAAVFGIPFHADGPGTPRLFVLDLATAASRTIAPATDFGEFFGSEGIVPIGVSADDTEILTAIRTGSASRVIARGRHGGGPPRTLFTSTRLIAAIEESATGYYVDQLDRSMEHLRYPTTGGVPDRLAAGLPTITGAGALALPNGRFVYATVIAGRSRLVVGRPGTELMPFVDTPEDARAPLATLTDKTFLFVAGTREQPVLAVAEAETGRVVRRLEGTRGRQIIRLAVSPDRATIYFAAAGRIWSIPSTDGEARELTGGNGIAVDPNGRFVIISREGAGGLQLLRRTPDGVETPLPLSPQLRATGLSLWPNSIDSRGRLVFVAESDDSWFWQPAVLDLATNEATRVPLLYAGDAEVDAAWDGDQITVLARRLESAIWRFDREPVNQAR